MSAGTNLVILIGYIAEPRNTTYGTYFSLATHQNKKVNGEWERHTEWTRISVAKSDKLFEAAAQLSKGAHLYVEGRLATRSWEKDGRKHWTTEVIPSVIKHL
jgi:single-strand DNA-binding protein